MANETIECGVEYPATTTKPRASRAGLVVHELVEVSMYMGTPHGDRYLVAETPAEIRDALADMPLATVRFFEVPASEQFFDLP